MQGTAGFSSHPFLELILPAAFLGCYLRGTGSEHQHLLHCDATDAKACEITMSEVVFGATAPYEAGKQTQLS